MSDAAQEVELLLGDLDGFKKLSAPVAANRTNGSAPGQSDRHWTHDLRASIVVFFVALPLCMGVALASGAPIAAGLITGIVGGIVAGSLAGCPLQVSGPAAGLTVIVYEIIQRLGLEMLGLAVIIAGVLQIAAGALRLGPWFRAISPAVVHGMLAGIGVLIFASQFHVMVDDKPHGTGLENLAAIPAAIQKIISVPQFASEPENDFRRHAMRALSNLQRDQAALRNQIVKLVPYVDATGTTPSLNDVIEPGLHDLAASQAQISSELDRISGELTNVEMKSKGAVDLALEKESLTEALDGSRRAEAALRSGRAVDAVKMQGEAVATIGLACSRLKNPSLAAWLGIITIAVLLLWLKFVPTKLRLVPAPLVAIVVATALAACFALPVLYVVIPESLIDEVRLPTWELLRNAPWIQLAQNGLLIAIVASAETLLCATAVDQMQKGERTNYDRELAAQGVGNAICGLLGALPMTGVIVRSSANVQAGGETRLSSILHGVWLLVFVVSLAGLLQMIPTASLAAVLVYTGYKLVNPREIKELLEFGWGEVAIYAATLITIVATDLLSGVIVGIALAAGKLLYTFSHLIVRLTHDRRQNRYVLNLTGAATFVRLPKLAAALERIPSDAELHVDLDHLTYVDHACLDLLTRWVEQHETSGGRLVIEWETLQGSLRRQPMKPPEIEEGHEVV